MNYNELIKILFILLKNNFHALDWGEIWKICYIPQSEFHVVKTTKIIVIVVASILGGFSAYAVSPYFTNSMIDEALPENTIPTMLSDMDETADTSVDVTQESMITTVSYKGNFVGVNDGIHNAEGIASVIPLDDGTTILRLEDFKSTNGPDLYVYLSTDTTASDFVSLGKLKANAGNQNYLIHANVDLSKYNKVLIWCKAFGVLFGSADLHQL